MAKQHIDREYNAHLEGIRESLLRMSGYVDEMIDDASRALSESDPALAKKIITRDALVDELESEVDERCILVLARWQPMASDLRFVTLAMKMVTDLERIGDLAVNIAERVPDLVTGMHPWTWDLATEMAKVCRAMLKDAIDALLERDVEKAQSVLVHDDTLDELYHRLFRNVLEGMQRRPDIMSAGIHALSIAKWLERMGDHVTNLAEQVIFLVRGEDVRHHVRFDVGTR